MDLRRSHTMVDMLGELSEWEWRREDALTYRIGGSVDAAQAVALAEVLVMPRVFHDHSDLKPRSPSDAALLMADVSRAGLALHLGVLHEGSINARNRLASLVEAARPIERALERAGVPYLRIASDEHGRQGQDIRASLGRECQTRLGEHACEFVRASEAGRLGLALVSAGANPGLVHTLATWLDGDVPPLELVGGERRRSLGDIRDENPGIPVTLAAILSLAPHDCPEDAVGAEDGEVLLACLRDVAITRSAAIDTGRVLKDLIKDGDIDWPEGRIAGLAARHGLLLSWTRDNSHLVTDAGMAFRSGGLPRAWPRALAEEVKAARIAERQAELDRVMAEGRIPF